MDRASRHLSMSIRKMCEIVKIGVQNDSSFFLCFQQVKREKALKDELVRELESKELEMQLLVQKQKSVSHL